MDFDLKSLIEAIGYLGLFAIVFAESGVLIGFILPGDSLLFTAGFLASQGILEITITIPLILVAAVLGDNTGYYIGKRFGHRVFKRPDARLLNSSHIKRAEQFYNRHGGKTLMLARYIPVVRTLAPLLAGVGKMPYRTFIAYDLAGCAIWSFGITLLGYYLGQSVPDIDRYLIPVIVLIVMVSLLPSVIHLLRHPRELKRIIQWLKQWLPGRSRD